MDDTDYCNPLLQKYADNFELFEFLRGSRTAFMRFNEVLGSRDFFNFVHGYVVCTVKYVHNCVYLLLSLLCAWYECKIEFFDCYILSIRIVGKAINQKLTIF